MAFRTKKISQMDPKGSNLASTDLLEISELVSGSYVTKSITGAEIAASAPAAAWGTITGTLSAQTDLNTALSGKVPTTRTLTINGTTQDLSADRTFTISTGITIGTTAITSGTVGRVLFEGTGNVVQESANLFFDATKQSLGLGTSDVATPLGINRGLVINGGTADVHLRLQNNNSGATATDGALLGYSFGELYLINFENGPLNIYTNNTARLRITNGGNVLINTTTDAGFKLDVNGTARVEQTLRVNGTGTDIAIQFRSGRIDNNGTFMRIKSPTNNQDMVNLTANFLGINETAVIPSAMMAITSTDRGFLPPRMTTTQKNAIASPATGLMVYDTTLNLISVYNGTTWISL